FATVTATNSNTTIDFVLIPAPPKMKVSMRLIYDGGWKYRFLIKSPKKLVTAPDCWYSPGQQFDSSKASQIPTIAGPNNSYGFDLSTLEDHEYYTLQVKIVTVDGKEDKEAIVFGPKIKALAKKDVKDELAEGGAFEIDETGDDVTQILLDAGTLEPKTDGTAVTGISVSGVGASAVGGFVTALPNFKLNKTSEEDTTLIDSLISNMVCSDIYEVNLKDAQINKSITLTMNYDSKKIKESDLKNLQICQYNSDKKKWETLSGTKTIDPITGTVSIEIESIAEAYKSTTTRLSSMAGRSMNTGSGFTINPMQATSQTGTFAIFSSTLPTKVGYAGSDFKIINFPNPFDLKSKNVSMTESGVGAGTVNQSLTGTMLKFYVPAGAGSADVKFYIYNIAGELVRKIESAKTIDGVDMSNIERGYIYYIEWDGKNDSKEECASGVYLLIPKVDNKKATERALKMAIIK
ncbi:MAG: hypothetical protein KJ967_02880, partial [Elusimicrobia bacterium]|nr:hypothetical protein [Elusimicrobiota bacterium]